VSKIRQAVRWWWIDVQLAWRNWWAGHRLVTVNHVARVAQQLANQGPGDTTQPGAVHWLALDRLTRELAAPHRWTIQRIPCEEIHPCRGLACGCVQRFLVQQGLKP